VWDDDLDDDDDDDEAELRGLRPSARNTDVSCCHLTVPAVGITVTVSPPSPDCSPGHQLTHAEHLTGASCHCQSQSVGSHAHGSRVGGVFSGVCLFVFLHTIFQKIDAARITKFDINMVHDESWKPIYFWPKGQRSWSRGTKKHVCVRLHKECNIDVCCRVFPASQCARPMLLTACFSVRGVFRSQPAPAWVRTLLRF